MRKMSAVERCTFQLRREGVREAQAVCQVRRQGVHECAGAGEFYYFGFPLRRKLTKFNSWAEADMPSGVLYVQIATATAKKCAKKTGKLMIYSQFTCVEPLLQV